MKKIIQILLICLMIAGIIIISTMGFNVGVRYSENTQINISIEKEFNLNDIRTISNEVFKEKNILIQPIELYKDMVQITIKGDVSDEQIQELNSKINEKYEINNTVEDNVIVSKKANTRLRDLVKPYILPLAISVAIIVLYLVIRFNKLGIFKVLYTTMITIIGAQAVLFSLYAVTRLPINKITEIVSIMLYFISVFVIVDRLQKKQKEKTDKN